MKIKMTVSEFTAMSQRFAAPVPQQEGYFSFLAQQQRIQMRQSIQPPSFPMGLGLLADVWRINNPAPEPDRICPSNSIYLEELGESVE